MMRIILLFLIVFICLFIAIQSPAQEVSWRIEKHSTTIKEFEKEVTAFANRGYTPLGITYDNKEFYVLYIKNSGLDYKSWEMKWYPDRNAIQEGVTGSMRKGLLPVGITYTGDLFYVLYIEVTNGADHWQLIPSNVSLNSVQNKIQPYIDRGYIPMGITFFKGEYWTLLLHIPDTTVRSWRIESYEVGKHAPLINQAIERGYVPWGLEYSGPGGKRIDILYVGF